jgi:ATP-dependent Lon protease
MIFFRKPDEDRPTPAPAPKDLRARAAETVLPEAARAAVDAELSWLANTDAAAAEYAISHAYVELVLALPWESVTKDNLDLARAEAVLDEGHAGLGQIKDRILEHLASRTMRQSREAWILVVDDEPIARENLRHVLAREGYRVETAENGQAALERVRRFEFDLIVTDLKMDRMDGLQLLEQAKKVSRPPGS